MVLSNFHLHEGPTSLGIDLFTAQYFYLEKVGDAYKKASHQDFRDQTTQRANMKTVPRAGNWNEGEQRRDVDRRCDHDGAIGK